MLKKPQTISSSGKLLVSWTILMHTELDSCFLFQILYTAQNSQTSPSDHREDFSLTCS